MKLSFRHDQSGATLMELVVALTVSALLMAAMAGWFARPVQALLESGERGAWTAQAQHVAAVLDAELAMALPNSLRVGCGGQCLEYLRVVGFGEYRVDAPGDFLDFAAPDTRFDIVPPLSAAPAGGQYLFINPLSADNAAPHGAYATGPQRPRSVIAAGSTVASMQFASHQFPAPSPAQRFYVVDAAVSLMCAPQSSGGTLRRLTGYGIAASQPTDVTQGALLSDRVVACRFRVLEPNLLAVDLTFGGSQAAPVPLFAQFAPGFQP